METTFESERIRLHKEIQEQKKLVEMNLSVKYDPGHDVRNKIIAFGFSWIMRLIGSDFRIKFIKHDTGE